MSPKEAFLGHNSRNTQDTHKKFWDQHEISHRLVYSITYFEKLQISLKLTGGQQQVASVPGVPIVRNDFFVLYGAYNRYVLQFQVMSVRSKLNGQIVATLLTLTFIHRKWTDTKIIIPDIIQSLGRSIVGVLIMYKF